MNDNDKGSMHGVHDGSAASPPGQDAQRISEPLPPGRAWVSEVVGFDSRLPAVPKPTEAKDDHFQYEKVSIEEARVAHDSVVGEPVAPGPASPLPPRPRGYGERLHDATILWLTELPEGLRPRELERLFPRIANKLCSLWPTAPLCNEYLTSLLMDTRDGARQGFPKAVAAELAALHGNVETYIKEHP